jgi:hypothetical protein
LAGQLEVTGELPVWTKSKAWLRYDMKISISIYIYISIYRWWDIIEFTINFCGISHWSFDFSAWNHWRGWLGQTQWTDLEEEQTWNWSLWDFMGIQRSNMGRPLNSLNTGIDHAEDLTILPLGEPWNRRRVSPPHGNRTQIFKSNRGWIKKLPEMEYKPWTPTAKKWDFTWTYGIQSWWFMGELY